MAHWECATRAWAGRERFLPLLLDRELSYWLRCGAAGRDYSCRRGHQLTRTREIVFELGGDLFRHVRTGPAKLRPQALLRGGPDHIAIFVDQAHRRHRLVTPFRRMFALALPDAEERRVGKECRSRWAP